MDEDKFELGKEAFHNNTTVHPLGLTMLILFGIALLLLPRRRAMIAVMACASFIAVGQRIVLFTLDFNFLRLLVIFGTVRIISRQEYVGFRWQPLDRWFTGWAVSALICYSLTNGGNGLIYKLGVSFEAIGMYFIVRMLVRDLDEVRGLVESMAAVSLIVFCIFLYEGKTGRNLFSVLGGVPEITLLRQGKLRCQGAYTHPILAGCFWATIVPLLFGRIFTPGPGRSLTIAGVFASLGVIFLCASSTPVCGLIAAAIGFGLFPARRYMRIVRWSIVISLTCLHMCMKNPVWHLISRTDLIGGSTGWHRFWVIDRGIYHFREWAVKGISDITHWDIFCNDVTNQYVTEGSRGGAVSLGIFLYMISIGFGNIGRLWRQVEKSRSDLILVWSIGVSLLVHIVNFFGVTYFGQIDMLWYIALALCAVSPTGVRVKSRVKPRQVSGQFSRSYDSVAYSKA